MWLAGAVVGLLFGAGFHSPWWAIVLAVVGGLIGQKLPRRKVIEAALAETLAETNELRQQVQQMERRVKTLEAKLAERRVPEASPAVPESSVPESSMPAAVATPYPAPVPSSPPPANAAPISEPPPAKPRPAAPAAGIAPATTVKAPELPSQSPPPLPARLAPPPVPPPIPPRTPDPAPRPAWRAPPLSPPPPSVPLRERLPEPLRKLIYGGNALVKVGVLILFLGLAFLLRYTAERVTVPLELRYAGVALVGAALLALGWRLRAQRRDYALSLQGMGVGVFYLTTLAAVKYHALLPPQEGFAFLFLVSLLGTALAVLQKAPVLAIIAALEGFATPVLTSTGGNQMLGLFTYLTILDSGILLIAWFNAWRSLNVIGFVGTFTLASSWAHEYYTDAQYAPVQAFLLLFFLMFAGIGLLFARRTLLETREQEKDRPTDLRDFADQAAGALAQVGRVDSALVFGTPLTAFALQYLLMKPWELGAAFSALALSGFYLLLARVVFSRERAGLALLADAYAIVGVIFGTLAIPLGLEGVWTGAAWAIEGAGMYWLGVRQRRPYACALAYLVLFGAAYKLFNSITINPTASGPLLQGSTIGPLLLAISAFAVWRQWRRARPKTEVDAEGDSDWETLPAAALPALGMAALTVLPWQWFSPPVAAAATAVLAAGLYFIASGLSLAAFMPLVGGLQALAVVSFGLSLHRGSAGAAALESGMTGLLAALLIAASILLTRCWSMASARKQALAEGLPASWSTGNAIAVVTAVGLLHVAMLFALDLQQVSLIWPLTAGVVLFAALRLAHGPLAALALVLQLVSVPLLWSEPQGSAFFAGVLPYGHRYFLAPLIWAVTAWWTGDLIRVEARRVTDGASGWLNPWCAHPIAMWGPVVWGLFWWLSAWLTESFRALQAAQAGEYFCAAAVAIVVVTSWLVARLAFWRNWRQMGMVSFFTLPALVLLAYGSRGLDGGATLPSADLGWIAWPLGLIWHLRLLRRQARWSDARFRSSFHVAGFWLFLLLAARDAQARMAQLADTAHSSWPMLGWVAVPAVAIWFLQSSWLARRWPMTHFRAAYLQLACNPVAIYLLLWCWLSNIASNGEAAPLPYLPLLNPLELGQWLILVALVAWWRALPDEASLKFSPSAVAKLTAVTGLALLTGTVLRSCHHFDGVPWDFGALFASRLAQAAVSITWAVAGVLAMLTGNRRHWRAVWFAGAALLGVVVVKLFVIELAEHGGLYRIVSFIGVGVLLLVVGYFAPVPVKREDAAPDREAM